MWVKKDSPEACKENISAKVQDPCVGEVSTREPVVSGSKVGSDPPLKNQDKPLDNTTMNDSESWTEVRKKKPSFVAPVVTPVNDVVSPSPPRTFKNLRSVDEVDKRKANSGEGSPVRLTRSQKKKLRLQKGSSPSPNP
ncbi:hypothetical protein ACET3Z_013190 [Daucus carota]